MKQINQHPFKWSLSISGLGLCILIGLVLIMMNPIQNVLAQPVIAPDAPLLTVHKSANVNEIPLGGTIEYTIVMTNTSVDAVTPVLTDTLHRAVSYVDDSVTVTPNNIIAPLASTNEIVFYPFPNQSLASGAQLTITFQVQVSSESITIGDTITNVATIHDGAETYPTNEVVLTISQPPTARIDEPTDGTIFTDREGTIKTISGVVWNTYDPAPFPATPVLSPIPNNFGDSSYKVEWTSPDTTNVYFSLQEASNSPSNFIEVYNGNELSYRLTGKAPGIYYYRVKATFADNNYPSRWSTIVSTTVESSNFLNQATATSVPTVDPVTYNAQPQGVTAAPIVNISINGGDWQTATLTAHTDYWSWEYDWALPQEETVIYTIRARAADSAGNTGPIDTIRVTIDNGRKYLYLPLVVRRWPPKPYAPTLNAISNSLKQDAYNVTWNYGSQPNVPTDYMLQQATKTDFSDATTYSGLSGTSRSFTNQPDNIYYYRVRGRNTWGYGPWSNIVSTEVQMRPDIPTLNAINNPDNEDTYNVTWSYTSPTGKPVNYYTLQQATKTDFSDATVIYDNGNATTHNVADNSTGTYYYRVRATNNAGQSDWSNIVSTVVDAQDLIYNFDTNGDTEGWSIRRWDDTSTDGYGVKAHSEDLYTYMIGRYDVLIASPMEEAPALPYTIHGRAKIVNGERIDDRDITAKSELSYGIVFGGNSGTPCPANVYTAKDAGCLEHYYRLLIVYNQGDGNFKWNLKRIDYHDPTDDGKGKGVGLIGYSSLQPGDALGWNEWKIYVGNESSNNIKIYYGSKLIGQVTDHTYVNDLHFGVRFESPPFGDVGVKWDWFKVEKQ